MPPPSLSGEGGDDSSALPVFSGDIPQSSDRSLLAASWSEPGNCAAVAAPSAVLSQEEEEKMRLHLRFCWVAGHLHEQDQQVGITHVCYSFVNSDQKWFLMGAFYCFCSCMLFGAF